MKQLNYHIKMHSFVTLTIHRTVVKHWTSDTYPRASTSRSRRVFDTCVSCFLPPQSSLILEFLRQGVFTTGVRQPDAMLELSIRGKHHSNVTSMMHTESDSMNWTHIEILLHIRLPWRLGTSAFQTINNAHPIYLAIVFYLVDPVKAGRGMY